MYIPTVGQIDSNKRSAWLRKYLQTALNYCIRFSTSVPLILCHDASTGRIRRWKVRMRNAEIRHGLFLQFGGDGTA